MLAVLQLNKNWSSTLVHFAVVVVYFDAAGWVRPLRPLEEQDEEQPWAVVAGDGHADRWTKSLWA